MSAVNRRTGYVLIYVQGRTRLEHRWVWEQEHGPIPAGYEIHHRDRDRANNALSNLEMLTRDEHHRVHTRLPRVKACAWCGGEFEPDVNNRGQTVHCSYSCARQTSWAKRRAGVGSVRPR